MLRDVIVARFDIVDVRLDAIETKLDVIQRDPTALANAQRV